MVGLMLWVMVNRGNTAHNFLLKNILESWDESEITVARNALRYVGGDDLKAMMPDIHLRRKGKKEGG